MYQVCKFGYEHRVLRRSGGGGTKSFEMVGTCGPYECRVDDKKNVRIGCVG